MNLLVTGGTGFIGTVLVERLAAAGHRGVVLDLWAPQRLPSGWEYLQGDVRDAALVRRTAQGRDGILHLAAAHHDKGISEANYFSVNRDGTRSVCDAADANGILRVCFFSTVAVYGNRPVPKDETSETEPEGPYGSSKLAGEVVMREWCAGGAQRQGIIIRPTPVIGPGTFANLYTLCRHLDHPVFVMVGDGSNLKSICYLENIVAATMLLWSQPPAAGLAIYNYADKPDLTSRKIVAQIRAGLSRSSSGIRIPLGLALLAALPFEAGALVLRRDLGVSRIRIRKLFQWNSVIEADRIRAAGFTPPVSLEEGLRRTLAWYVAEGKRQTHVKRIPPEP